MQRVYGLQPASELPINAAAKTVLDGDHGFEFKKVPLQCKGDGHIMLSDLASPEESVYAKRKLLSKQRKEYAMQI